MLATLLQLFLPWTSVSLPSRQYCAALEVVVTTALACLMQRRWIEGREVLGVGMIFGGLLVCFAFSQASKGRDYP